MRKSLLSLTLALVGSSIGGCLVSDFFSPSSQSKSVMQESQNKERIQDISKQVANPTYPKQIPPHSKKNHSNFEPLDISIVASDDSGKIIYSSPITAELGKIVYLHAVMRVRENGVVYTITDPLIAERQKKPVRTWKENEFENLEWFKVEPESYNHNNVHDADSAKWHYHKILYQESRVEGGLPLILANASMTNPEICYKPNLFPNQFGTMRYMVSYDDGKKRIQSRGKESISEKNNGGIFLISFKLTNFHPSINAASILGNVPYVYGADDKEGGQAEKRIASDCANTVYFGARHAMYDPISAKLSDTVSGTVSDSMDKKMSESMSGIIKVPVQRLPKMQRMPRIPDVSTASFEPGRYVSLVAGPISFDHMTSSTVRWGNKFGEVQSGDLVLWRGHVGILAEDSNKNKILDGIDSVFHHCYSPVRFESLKDAYPGSFRIVRFK